MHDSRRVRGTLTLYVPCTHLVVLTTRYRICRLGQNRDRLGQNRDSAPTPHPHHSHPAVFVFDFGWHLQAICGVCQKTTFLSFLAVQWLYRGVYMYWRRKLDYRTVYILCKWSPTLATFSRKLPDVRTFPRFPRRWALSDIVLLHKLWVSVFYNHKRTMPMWTGISYVQRITKRIWNTNEHVHEKNSVCLVVMHLNRNIGNRWLRYWTTKFLWSCLRCYNEIILLVVQPLI